MAAGPLPPAPGDPPAPPGPSPDSEQPGDDTDAASAPAPRARRVIVPAGDHLWGGRDGSPSVAAVCPWTVAVLERGQPEAQSEAPASSSFVDGPADGRPPSRLHIVCHRGARLWGQVRASPPRRNRPRCAAGAAGTLTRAGVTRLSRHAPRIKCHEFGMNQPRLLCMQGEVSTAVDH
jgi:hypothetical protein